MYSSSVMDEISLLLLGFLLLHSSKCVSSKESRLEETVKNDPTEIMFKNDNGDKFEELMQRMERMEIGWKLEKAHLETKLEAQNIEMNNHQQQLEEMSVQFENRDKEVADQNCEVGKSLKNEIKMQCKAEVKKELDKVLPTAVEQGLRDLPFEMVCAFQGEWTAANSVINYQRISMEFNNSDRPGGADGSMNIETGVFTTVTSGYYIVTFSGHVTVHAGEYTVMYLYHNGIKVYESQFETYSGGDFIQDQGSRTVVSIACL